MKFEDMKMIWDAQNATELYAYDRQGLEQRVIRRREQVKRGIDRAEQVVVTIVAATGVVNMMQPVSHGHGWQAMVNGAIFMLVAGYLWFRRGLRRRMHTRFDRSLLGTLDESISQLDDYVRHLRGMVWWLGIPYLAMLGISYAWLPAGKSPWSLVVLFFALPLALWLTQREITHKHLPRKREFEQFREKLNDMGTGTSVPL